ncbi:DUF4240 domain-containing protein [Dactylosporangium sp. CA-233914]|uniref:DUF4240 domain-containing protein n=1 Tax=Dactylosporangium sp. CA-233914 TaxID=3239934 RepID=UPI003D900478
MSPVRWVAKQAKTYEESGGTKGTSRSIPVVRLRRVTDDSTARPPRSFSGRSSEGAFPRPTPRYRAEMDERWFWRIVDGTVAGSERQIELLRGALVALPADEVLSFRRQFVAAHRRAYTRQMWLAAALLYSHPGSEPDLGDDGFTDFRSWLISRGHAVFTQAIDNPDTIADIPDEDDHDPFCHGETFAEIPDDVYEELSGKDVPDGEDIVELLGDPTGPSMNLTTAAMSTQFPRLTARRQHYT